MSRYSALYERRGADAHDYRDPACPYDDDFTPEDEEALWEYEIDKEIDERLEREH